MVAIFHFYMNYYYTQLPRNNAKEILKEKRDLKLYGTCIEATGGKNLAADPLIASKNGHFLFKLKKYGILKTRDFYSFRKWRIAIVTISSSFGGTETSALSLTTISTASKIVGP